MPLSTKTGWGFTTAFMPVTSSVAGPINAVLRNVGAAISVVAGDSPIRLTKLSWRVDLSPDVAAGTVNSPTRWRVVVVAGVLPPDIGAWQAQAYAAGAHPEIPLLTAMSTPLPTLHDLWLDFSAGDPGLNRIASESWADAGPTVNPGETMSALIIPIIDATLSQSLPGVANAQITIAMSGCGFASAQGSGNSSSGSASLPRYDVRA